MLEKEKIHEYLNRLLLSRIRILDDYGFYGLLLMHIIFSIDEKCKTAATDGQRIYFGPVFLESLSDNELDIIMMHEILHVVLLHVLRGEDLENERFNIACDIVVNSNIMLERGQTKPISLSKFGELMHLAPTGKEGYLYTAEEIYEMLQPQKKNGGGGNPDNSPEIGDAGGSPGKKGGKISEKPEFGTGRAGKEQANQPNGSFADDHTRWGTIMEKDSVLRDIWTKNIMEAAEAISIQESNRNRGTLPAFAKRILEKLRKPQIDWRTILNDFVQEEINDYSFSPPDRRFDDSPFYLPDFNEKDEKVRNILFMIDTSGSMSDKEIAAAFSEVAGAIEQFGGKLTGKLGFFDAAIIEPVPFESVEELKRVEPVGGGGTDFQIIFEYVARYMEEEPPASIIILTDGIAPFPNERLANEIPVLWLLNNDDVEPPWGKVARIKV